MISHFNKLDLSSNHPKGDSWLDGALKYSHCTSMVCKIHSQIFPELPRKTVASGTYCSLD